MYHDHPLRSALQYLDLLAEDPDAQVRGTLTGAISETGRRSPELTSTRLARPNIDGVIAHFLSPFDRWSCTRCGALNTPDALADARYKVSLAASVRARRLRGS
jgi:hypothetical protein